MINQKARDILSDILVYTAGTYNCIAMSRYYLTDEHAYPSVGTVPMLTNALSIYGELCALQVRPRTWSHSFLHDRTIATVMNNIGRVKFAAGDFYGALSTYMEAPLATVFTYCVLIIIVFVLCKSRRNYKFLDPFTKWFMHLA